MRYITKTERQTFILAKKFAKTLKGGEIIGLIGDLGAGKTIFTKGLAAGLGIKQTITSPTFILMKVFRIKKLGIRQFVHVDAYRLKKTDDLTAIGLEEYFNRQDSVAVIEWADKIKKILPNKASLVKISVNKDNRIISFN